MKYLSDQMLIEVYERAVDLQLDHAFVELVFDEIQRRNIYLTGASA